MMHGTVYAYGKGCRCEECRAASTAAKRRWRSGDRPGRTPSGIQSHGWNGYQRHGCRCDVCRAANAAQQRRYKAKRRERSSS